MKKIIVVLAALPLLLTGTACIKETGCQNKTIQSETGAMTAFAAANSINGTTHSTGLIYEITQAGTGANALPTSNVKVRYTGKYLDGNAFETVQVTPAEVRVDGTIPGWQIALQLLNEGAKIKVIIPSALAYGCGGKAPIPGNTILYFEIELVDIL
ncbi:MAG TPA: FKBP-type peptidyl-prolyl cis-trans isomerase [Chitinophagaceae bacterium]|jgi:FKBP-type peptidyl-prolyl cis-trans isomerase|nr:FKBP-type peptidyl-prolyl cis-trans isomerase [Chitinophagaceae bacterium]